MPKVLMTGAAGFIGFHVTNRLLQEGFEVVGLDNLNPYYDPKLKIARLEKSGIDPEKIIYNELLSSSTQSGLKFIFLDLQDKDKIDRLFNSHEFDYVVHLAAQPGARQSLMEPYSYAGSNINGFLPILENCRSHPVKHLVYASSSSIYGNNVKRPYSESDRVDFPISLYAATKRANELMAYAYAHAFNVPLTGLRFFTVYGPWGRPDMAYFKFAEAILKDQPVEVFNNGNLERDFTYIDDIVYGVVEVMKKIPVDPVPYKLFNIGHSEAVNLNYFIGLLEKHLNKKAVKILKPMQPGDILSTCADTTLLEEYIGFKPYTSIEQGLKLFVEWYLNDYRKITS